MAQRAQFLREAAGRPGAWGAAAMPPGRFSAMAVKYGALLDALYQAEPLRSRLLGRIARRHTGALREAQLVPPRVLLERFRLAVDAARRPAHSRVHHLAGPTAAVVLWHDLHDLLGDQLAARRNRRRGALVLGVPGDLRPTAAYRILARAADLAPADLQRVLRV